MGANGVTYCLWIIAPPTQIEGSERPVPPYRVKELFITTLSAANFWTFGVKSTR